MNHVLSLCELTMTPTHVCTWKSQVWDEINGARHCVSQMSQSTLHHTKMLGYSKLCGRR